MPKNKEPKPVCDMTYADLVHEAKVQADAAYEIAGKVHAVAHELRFREATKNDPKLTLKEIHEFLFNFTDYLPEEKFQRVCNTLKARFPSRTKSIEKIYGRHFDIVSASTESSQYDRMVERYTDFIYRITK